MVDMSSDVEVDVDEEEAHSRRRRTPSRQNMAKPYTNQLGPAKASWEWKDSGQSSGAPSVARARDGICLMAVTILSLSTRIDVKMPRLFTV